MKEQIIWTALTAFGLGMNFGIWLGVRVYKKARGETK